MSIKILTRFFSEHVIDSLRKKGFGLIELQKKEENEMEHEIGCIFEPLQIDNIFSTDKHDDRFCHSIKEILSKKIIILKKRYRS